jgi:hypothetical protein
VGGEDSAWGVGEATHPPAELEDNVGNTALRRCHGTP